MNIQYVIGKWFESRERAYYMSENAYVCLIRTNIPHVTHNYRPGKSKFYICYYIQS